MDARDLVNKACKVYSPPTVFRRLTQLLNDAQDNSEEIIEIISFDPGLTARVLKAANGKSGGSIKKIDNVYDAVSTIGVNDLSILVTTITAVDSFRHVGTDLVDMDNFWNHSVCCGLAGRILAERCGQASPEQVFIAGVLHDIGQLVIYDALPELATAVLRKAGEAESYRYRAEKEIIGITHAEIGAELIRSWGLPEQLGEMVRFHHEPIKAVDYPVETALVHISTGLSNQIEPSWKMDLVHRDSFTEINPHVWTMTGLSPELVRLTLEDVNVESFGVMCLMDPTSVLIF